MRSVFRLTEDNRRMEVKLKSGVVVEVKARNPKNSNPIDYKITLTIEERKQS